MNLSNQLGQPLNYIWGGLFFLTMIAPSLWFMFGAKSMVTGLTAVVVFYFIVVLRMYSLSTIWENLQSIYRVLAAVLIFVFFHGLINYYVHIEQFCLTRFSLSFLYLIFFMLGAFSFAMVVTKIRSETCKFILYFVIVLFVVVALLSIIGFSPFQDGGKPMVVYSEPSHYALSVLPFLLFIVIQASPKNKIIYLLIAFEFALIIQSLTLIAGIVFISMIALQVRTVPIIIGIFVTLYYIDPLIQNFLNVLSPNSPLIKYHLPSSTYIGSRIGDPILSTVSESAISTVSESAISTVSESAISTVLKSVNGSFLVYFSGWERAYLNFLNYFGFGSGFQQLGIVGDKGIAMERLIDIYRRPMGLLDGGAVAAKFLSEFGLFALLLLGIYTRYFFTQVGKLRSVSHSTLEVIDIKNSFFMCCFVIYSVNLFIRGLGYFSPSSFLFLSSIFWVLLSKKRMSAAA